MSDAGFCIEFCNYEFCISTFKSQIIEMPLQQILWTKSDIEKMNQYDWAQYFRYAWENQHMPNSNGTQNSTKGNRLKN